MRGGLQRWGRQRIGNAVRVLETARVRDPRDDWSLRVPFAPAALAEAPAGAPRVAIVCHLFHADLAEALLDRMRHVPAPADVLITTDTEQKRRVIERVFAAWSAGAVVVRVVPNRGRDIAPKLVAFREEYPRYDLLLFLHSKRSTHMADGDAWRDGLLAPLVGSRETVRSVLALFAAHPRVGFVLPQHFEPLRDWIIWNANLPWAWPLARRMGFRLPLRTPIDFPSGSMFWARPAALRPLLDLGLTAEDFPVESGQVNTTVHHAVERLLLFACEHAGLTWVKVAAVETRTAAPVQEVRTRMDLDEFVERRTVRLLPAARRRRRVSARAAPPAAAP